MFPELDGYATLQDKLFARDNQDANMEDEFEDCTLSSDDPGVKKLKAEEVSTSEMSSEELSSDDPGLEKVLNVASHTSSSELSPAPEVPRPVAVVASTSSELTLASPIPVISPSAPVMAPPAPAMAPPALVMAPPARVMARPETPNVVGTSDMAESMEFAETVDSDLGNIGDDEVENIDDDEQKKAEEKAKRDAQKNN